MGPLFLEVSKSLTMAFGGSLRALICYLSTCDDINLVQEVSNRLEWAFLCECLNARGVASIVNYDATGDQPITMAVVIDAQVANLPRIEAYKQGLGFLVPRDLIDNVGFLSTWVPRGFALHLYGSDRAPEVWSESGQVVANFSWVTIDEIVYLEVIALCTPAGHRLVSALNQKFYNC